MPDEPESLTASDEPRRDRFVSTTAARRIYWFVAATIVVLLILHTVKWNRVNVDTTSVVLVGLLLLLPVAPYIRKLKVFELEAEIDPRDVQRLRASASELPPAEPEAQVDEEGEVGEVGDEGEPDLEIMWLVRRDPPLGLAKLRLELEKELRKRYYALSHVERPKGRPLQSAMPMLRDLDRAGVIGRDIAVPLVEVIRLATRAIHGEYVRRDDAVEIAEVGVRVLETLRSEDLPPSVYDHPPP